MHKIHTLRRCCWNTASEKHAGQCQTLSRASCPSLVSFVLLHSIYIQDYLTSVKWISMSLWYRPCTSTWITSVAEEDLRGALWRSCVTISNGDVLHKHLSCHFQLGAHHGRGFVRVEPQHDRRACDGNELSQRILQDRRSSLPALTMSFPLQRRILFVNPCYCLLVFKTGGKRLIWMT